MNRRQLLVSGSIGLGLPIAGCLDGIGQTNEVQDDGGTPTGRSSKSLVEGSTPDRQPVASSRWIEEPAEAVNIYSSDEPPVAELAEIVALFDNAVVQDEWEPEGEDHRETPEVGLGEPVSTGIDEETYEAIQAHYDRDEFYRGGTPGWIFDHEGTLVTLDIGKPS